MTDLIAHRVAPGIPIWNILTGRKNIGAMTNLPMERAWCLTAQYCGRTLDFRASTREAVLLALRCAVDAIDYIEAEAEEFIEDEDGEIARMRYNEMQADAWSMRHDVQEPVW